MLGLQDYIAYTEQKKKGNKHIKIQKCLPI